MAFDNQTLIDAAQAALNGTTPDQIAVQVVNDTVSQNASILVDIGMKLLGM